MSTLAAARWYAQHGLRVHPLRPGSKVPVLTAWQDRATTDPAILEPWWRDTPGAGVGLVTGQDSGLLVVDIDPKNDGDDSLAQLERKHGEVPATWRCLTAHDGLHLYFRHPGAYLADRIGLWPGIDVRCDGRADGDGHGGNIVAPPTALSDGMVYRWEIGYGPHEIALAVAPAWLVEVLRQPEHAARGATRTPDKWAMFLHDGADTGRRNDFLTRVAGYLLRRFWFAPHVVLELVRHVNTASCRPPLPDGDVMDLVDSICGRERKTRMRRLG